MTTQEKLTALRQLMEKQGIDIYIVPTADYHQSEYVGKYFEERAFLTGFTGSAGTAVVTKEAAYLWTDGRYFIQAAQQLEGSGIELQKMGEPGVPTIDEFLKDTLAEKGILGFDGRTIDLSQGKAFEEIVNEKNGKIIANVDLVGEVWTDRPELSKEPAFLLEEKYTGESTESKLARIREAIAKAGATTQIITSLDDIDWMLNIRGNDVSYFPLLLSYAVVNKDNVELYADESKFDASIQKMFAANHVKVYPYNDIYERVKTFTEEDVLFIDPTQTNYALFSNIPENVKTVQKENPIILMKSIKNEVEIQNIRRAHLKDAIAHTKFMYWLKTNVGKMRITEISASEKLESLRAEQEGFIRPSFGPISAYKEHAALCHYSSTPETDVELKPEGLFLTDTGGGYLEGSTDITRTVSLGPVSIEQKKHFTIVVCSMLTLADARFLYGCDGSVLDYAAREPFWRAGLNFNHGTGHGVGYLGNIHEGPARIAWNQKPEVRRPLEAGQIVTDEPGIYIEGSHGIRIENELLVCNGKKNGYGQFMYFEPLTFVPIDLDALDKDAMTVREKMLLDAYHRKVFSLISPYLNEDEKNWLRVYTRQI